jgi:predicted dehydrogenase
MNWKKTPENSGGVWRVSSSDGNAGTLSDLGVHVYDAARLLCGDFSKIYCRFARYDKGIARIGRFKLDAPDTFYATITFRSGIIGEIHSTRWAAGFGDGVLITVSGTKGSFIFDLDRNPDAYRWYSHKRRKWEEICCKHYPSTWERFAAALKSGKNDHPNFSDGLAIQTYLESSIRSDKIDKPVAL